MEKAALNVRKLGFKVIVPQPSHIRHGHKPAELKNKYDLKTLTRWEGEGAFAHLDNIRKAVKDDERKKANESESAFSIEKIRRIHISSTNGRKFPAKSRTFTMVSAIYLANKFSAPTNSFIN